MGTSDVRCDVCNSRNVTCLYYGKALCQPCYIHELYDSFYKDRDLTVDERLRRIEAKIDSLLFMVSSNKSAGEHNGKD